MDIQQLLAAFEKKTADLNLVIGSMAAEIKTHGTVSAELKAAAEKLATEHNAIGARLLEVEQKLAARVDAGDASAVTVGQSLIKSTEFQRFAAGEASKIRFEAKNTVLGGPETVAPNRLPGVVGGAFRALRVRDVLLSGQTASNSIEYTRELVFTDNAAEVAEGAQRGESDITFELADSPVRTVAHFIKISKQALSDAPAVASYIDTRLRHGVEQRIDAQLLKGNGSGQNLKGLQHADNSAVFTPTAGESAIDSINRAVYQVWSADYAPSAVILNPADWGAIERVKGTNGQYVFGDPANGNVPSVWGLPVVVTNAQTSGKFSVGAFNAAAQVFDRQSTMIELSESDGTDFQKSIVTIKAEARLALAVYRPAAIVHGDLTAPEAP